MFLNANVFDVYWGEQSVVGGAVVGGARASRSISCSVVPGMDMADEYLTRDLDSFLCEWRRELSQDPRRFLGKSARDSEEESAEAPARKQAALYGTASNDPPPLLVLPADGGRRQSIREPVALRGEEVGGRGSRSLVDTLIADLVSWPLLT